MTTTWGLGNCDIASGKSASTEALHCLDDTHKNPQCMEIELFKLESVFCYHPTLKSQKSLLCGSL